MILSAASSSSLMLLGYIVIFGGIFYFMILRPQRKQKKERDTLNASMQPGDCVLTTSGFYGVIIDVQGDTVIVEFGSNRNCRIPMQRDSIAALEKPKFSKTEEE